MTKRLLLACSLLVLLPFVVRGQRVLHDWLTFGGDPARTGWAVTEATFSKDNVSKLELKWKAQLDNAPSELASLTAPVIIENLTTSRGFKDLLFVAGSSDNLYAIDVDSGQIFWKKHFTNELKPKLPPRWLCPEALNATPVIDKQSRTIYLITSDGKLRGMNVFNGEDRFPPTDFVPPFSKNWSLNLVDGVVYTTISQGCGEARSGIAAMDLKDPARPVTTFYTSIGGPAGVWGRAGAVLGPKGLYIQTGDGPWDPATGRWGDTVVALEPKTLKLADYYTPANREFITKKDLDMGCASPVIFPYKDRQLVASAGKEGVIYLLDANSLGGPDHRKPLFSARYSNDDIDFAGRGVWGGISTWQDEQGQRWIYVPTWGPPSANAPKFKTSYGDASRGSIMAFRVDGEADKPTLVPVWISRDMSVPEPPVIANGVVFALANGENARQVNEAGVMLTSKQRADTKTGNPILYALDATTGKELYSSQSTIEGFTHFSGLALASGRIYVSTFGSQVYSFGLKE